MIKWPKSDSAANGRAGGALINNDGGRGPIVIALIGLELGVDLLQAHVSTILLSLYLNDATNPHNSWKEKV